VGQLSKVVVEVVLVVVVAVVERIVEVAVGKDDVVIDVIVVLVDDSTEDVAVLAGDSEVAVVEVVKVLEEIGGELVQVSVVDVLSKLPVQKSVEVLGRDHDLVLVVLLILSVALMPQLELVVGLYEAVDLVDLVLGFAVGVSDVELVALHSLVLSP
jgi:hypothetical protein